MKILGIDYGRAKIGLATAEGPLAEPDSVLRVNSLEDSLEKVKRVIGVKGVNKVVVGVSEGKMGEEQQRFADLLASQIEVPVETWDETLSTQDAQSLSIASGKGRKKRRDMEDAYAASLVVQSYLDGN